MRIIEVAPRSGGNSEYHASLWIDGEKQGSWEWGSTLEKAALTCIASNKELLNIGKYDLRTVLMSPAFELFGSQYPAERRPDRLALKIVCENLLPDLEIKYLATEYR